jgi:beta-lactamase superfamily II metal-dependent hydrolase
MRRLVQRHPEGTWDVVVLPHHGLNPETAADFIDAVRPQLALASYTDTPPAMERLEVETMETASFGAITIRSSPAGLAARGHLGGEVLAPKAGMFDMEAAGGTINGYAPGGATQ